MYSSTSNWDIIFHEIYFGLLGNTHILVYYPRVSSQKIEVYRVETMDMVNI